MPAGDGTGPWGMGPMTGRGAGYCAGYGVAGCYNPLPLRRGGGFGRRHRFWATGMPGRFWRWFGAPDTAVEKELLEGRIKVLEGELDALKRRLGELGPQGA